MASFAVIGIGAAFTAGVFGLGSMLGYAGRATETFPTPLLKDVLDFGQVVVRNNFKAAVTELNTHMDGRERLWTYIGNRDDPRLYQAVEQGVQNICHRISTCTQGDTSTAKLYHTTVQEAVTLLIETGLLKESSLPDLENGKKGLPTAFPISSPLCSRIYAHYPQIATRITHLLTMQFANRVKHEEAQAIKTELTSVLQHLPGCLKSYAQAHTTWRARVWEWFGSPYVGTRPVSDLVILTDRITKAWDLVYPEYRNARSDEFQETLTRIAALSKAALRATQDADFKAHFSKEASYIEGALAHIKVTYCELNQPVSEAKIGSIRLEAAKEYLEQQNLWWWQRP